MQDKNPAQNDGNNNAIFPIQGERRRGRPRKQRQEQEGWSDEAPVSRPRSAAMHRRWQRDMIAPKFHLTRKEALEVFFKYLRSTRGKEALRKIIAGGSPGIEKLNDGQLGRYLEQTNLLSRYPHEVLIQG